LEKKFFNSEVNLILRLRRSDKDAFEMIFNQYKERLYYFAMGYLHSEQESEEIIQNVFISLWENRDILNEALPIRNYLYKVTVNHIYNHFRHQSVKQEYALRILTEETSEHHDVEETIFVNDLEDMVDKLVGELPYRQQLIYELSRKEGLCHAEIARKLGLTVRSVENQIYRALKYIREKLKQESLLAE
jgi:RNA polymerase sigma-70 factor (ECF subfamily)